MITCSPLGMRTDLLIFARGPITSFVNTAVPTGSIVRAEENTVIVIHTVIMSLKTPVRCIPLTFITEWLARKRANSTPASRGVIRHGLLSSKQRK